MEIRVTCEAADSLPLDSLENFQGSLKKITKENLEKLKKQIVRNGFNVPFFVWRTNETSKILDGHQRLKALSSLRDDGHSVPNLPVAYIYAENERDAKQKLLAITSQYGEFEIEELRYWIEDLDEELTETLRFVDSELTLEIDLTEEETVGDDDFSDEVLTVSQEGDLWELNSHRVLCGDSLKIDEIEKLMDGKKADICVTDPPYNVDYVGKTKDALTIENDKKDDESFRAFLVDAFYSLFESLKPGGCYYIWHADSEGYNFRHAVIANGQKVRQCLIWNKNSMVMGRQDYHWKHEPCLYGWKEGAGHLWAADRTQTTIIDHDRPSRSTDHPTMKPVGLMEYCIKNNTKGEDLVLDLFLGSGSTLLAADKSGRICYGLELGPNYCDVIVSRWINWRIENGLDVSVRKNGEPFDHSVFIKNAG